MSLIDDQCTGGYWGGGAGANSDVGAGGGGGSGFSHPTLVSGAVLTAGSTTTPGDSGNVLRGSAGNAGASGPNAGSSGVFIVRYPTPASGFAASGGAVTVSGGFVIHTFTASGTLVA